MIKALATLSTNHISDLSSIEGEKKKKKKKKFAVVESIGNQSAESAANPCRHTFSDPKYSYNLEGIPTINLYLILSRFSRRWPHHWFLTPT